MTQEQSGQLIGVTRHAIAAWEAGESEASVVSIARLLAAYREQMPDPSIADPSFVLFGVRRPPLPPGTVVIDRDLVDAIMGCRSGRDVRKLSHRMQLEPRMFLCAVAVPHHVEVVRVDEGDRISDDVEQRARELAPELAQEWARILIAKLGG